MVAFMDSRWEDDRSLFAMMEIDLSKGGQLVYIFPDTTMTIADFCRNVVISIKTKGYSTWRGGEANLLVTRGAVARLTNTSNVGFAYHVEGVVDHLASHGVQAKVGRKYSTEELRGTKWNLRAPEVPALPMMPTSATTRNNVDGSISMKFGDYVAQPSSSGVKFNEHDEEIPSDDEESVRNEQINVLIMDDANYDHEVEEDNWDTLGQPSGKFDFYVKYSKP